jgi:hypothetical protein
MGPVGVELEQVHPFQAITGHSDAAGAEVGPDGRTLYVVWEGYSRGCTRLAGVDIRALGDGRLAIRVAEGVPLLWQFSWSCSLAHHVRATRVTLDAPLPPGPVELVPFGSTAEA